MGVIIDESWVDPGPPSQLCWLVVLEPGLDPDDGNESADLKVLGTVRNKMEPSVLNSKHHSSLISGVGSN